ncbi:hypothetical protein, partial [Streptomyces thioluteus]|uniref:hypothetical protein n=1 Tax=Streptomyces thioluteus TaxID=66431 RepID=UPI0031EA729E
REDDPPGECADRAGAVSSAVSGIVRGPVFGRTDIVGGGAGKPPFSADGVLRELHPVQVGVGSNAVAYARKKTLPVRMYVQVPKVFHLSAGHGNEHPGYARWRKGAHPGQLTGRGHYFEGVSEGQIDTST